MSDLFLTWRKTLDGEHHNLDGMLELAFEAGREAEGQRLRDRLWGQGLIAKCEEVVERTIWIGCVTRGFPPLYATSSRSWDVIDRFFRTAQDRLSNGDYGTEDEIPDAVHGLAGNWTISRNTSGGDLKRAVLINGTWSLRDADGA